MKVATKDLSGAALDYAVALAEGWRFGKPSRQHSGSLLFPTERPNGSTVGVVFWDGAWGWGPGMLQPTRNWMEAGEIIEREGISLSDPHDDRFHPGQWAAYIRFIGTETRGPTPRVAAMRCYVTRKLGEFVEIPDELLQ